MKALSKLNPTVPQSVTDIVRATLELEIGLSKKLGLPVSPIGNFAHRVISNGMKVAFVEAVEDFRKDGKMSEDYLSSAQAQYNTSELLDFLDGETPDEKKFEIMKNIFLRASTETETTRKEIRPQQYMQIVKTLPAGAVLILNTCFLKYVRSEITTDQNGRIEVHKWRELVAKESGLFNTELVINYEEILEKNHLISSLVGLDKDRVAVEPYFRLTELGFSIMEFASELPKKK